MGLGVKVERQGECGEVTTDAGRGEANKEHARRCPRTLEDSAMSTTAPARHVSVIDKQCERASKPTTQRIMGWENQELYSVAQSTRVCERWRMQPDTMHTDARAFACQLCAAFPRQLSVIAEGIDRAVANGDI